MQDLVDRYGIAAGVARRFDFGVVALAPTNGPAADRHHADGEEVDRPAAHDAGAGGELTDGLLRLEVGVVTDTGTIPLDPAATEATVQGEVRRAGAGENGHGEITVESPVDGLVTGTRFTIRFTPTSPTP